MKIKSVLAATAVSAALLVSATTTADSDVLTGDTRLACEAILCLSSAQRPSECSASLSRYFSIKLKKPHKTLAARKHFLHLCPTSNDQGMPQLVDTLVNAAGRCDAAALNRRGHYVGDRENRRFVPDTVKPSYCQAYENHEWTDAKTQLQPVYCTREVFNRKSRSTQTQRYQCGQKWVDVK